MRIAEVAPGRNYPEGISFSAGSGIRSGPWVRRRAQPHKRNLRVLHRSRKASNDGPVAGGHGRLDMERA
jgi:hypothetical protein